MTAQIIGHLERVFHVPLNPQRKGLQALQEQKRVERAQRRAGVAQEIDPRLGDVRRGAGRVGQAQAVIAGIGLGQAGKFAGAAQSNFPPSTITPPMVVPWPPMNFVAEWTTISAP